MSEITHDEQGPIAQVREGMTVVDAAGQEVGTVRAVRMGDPQAATSQGQGSKELEQGGVLGAMARALSSAESLPAGLGERLLRLGYVQIDAAGLFTGDRFAASDEIAQVSGDTVRLSVGSQALAG